MDLNIGQNIKKLRLQKNMTQEQLASLLSISTAAISKWEARNTYPDITLLLPLANIFGVTVDELMGHDTEKEQQEIDGILKACRELEFHGQFAEADALICNARKSYPHDYRVMRAYMWRLAGGENCHDTQKLLSHDDELLQICDCILDGCKDERIRLDALNLQAKLFYAAGDKSRAIKILSSFPSSFQTAAQKIEQLFPKDTAEYRYHNRKNLYGLLDVTANKAVRMIWYDHVLSLEEKITRIEQLGDTMTSLRQSMPLFAIPEQMIFSELAGQLSVLERVNDVIRIRKKQFDAMSALETIAKEDDVLRDSLLAVYKTDRLVEWLCEWLSNASQTQLVRLRQNKAYCEMLSSFSCK